MTHDEELYLDFLTKSVELDGKSSNYICLLEHLFKRKFYPGLGYELDLDRERVGIDMRENYAKRYVSRGHREAFLMGLKERFGRGISVLEFMVSMSEKMSETLYFEPNYSEFFWSMIDNLGLDCMSDDEFDGAIVDHILENLWARKYARDGSGGGLFFVPNSKFDMRKIDFMLQANLWLSYNFVRG